MDLYTGLETALLIVAGIAGCVLAFLQKELLPKIISIALLLSALTPLMNTSWTLLFTGLALHLAASLAAVCWSIFSRNLKPLERAWIIAVCISHFMATAILILHLPILRLARLTNLLAVLCGIPLLIYLRFRPRHSYGFMLYYSIFSILWFIAYCKFLGWE